MDGRKNLLILTGGTGGHVAPAIALYEQLASKYNVKVMCDNRVKGYINDAFNKEDVKIIQSSAISISLSKILTCLIKNTIGFIQVLIFFLKYKPDLIVSFGSYTTFIPLLVATLMRKKFILYEQNSVIGKVNLYFMKFALKSFFALPVLNKLDEMNISDIVPCPIQKKFLNGNTDYPDDVDGIVISVIGGSQGAAIFGYVVPEAIKNIDLEFRKKIKTVYHQVIEQDIYRVTNCYMNNNISCVVAKFFNNLDEIFTKSHIIIARSGAATIAEICAVGRAAILVPYPYASENHQLHNANLLKDNDAALVIEQNKFTSESLSEILTSFLKNDTKLKNMAKNAKNMYTNNPNALSKEIEKFLTSTKF